MRRLVAPALAVVTVAVIADGRYTGPLALVMFAIVFIGVLGHAIRQRTADTEPDLTLAFIAEDAPDRPSIATHDITEIANALGRGRRGTVAVEIADRLRAIASERLDDRDLRHGDVPAEVSPTLASMLEGAELRADQLDSVLTELERL